MTTIRSILVGCLGITVLAMSGACGSNTGLPGLPMALDVGQLCDLGTSAESSEAVVNTAASECSSRICLKPAQSPTKSQMSPPTGGTCTIACDSDADCMGEARDATNSADTRCKAGFVCGMPLSVGPLCCQKLCMCRDFIGSEGATPPLACIDAASAASCKATGTGPSSVGQQTNLFISIAPIRKLDLVVMIDNSPGMASKVSKFNKQFPKLLTALKDPTDGTYPDLRVALLDSDLGTGGAYSTGSCGPNDSNQQNAYGDVGNFQMRGATGCGMRSGDALWIEYSKGTPVNYSGDLGTVFSCLATNLGSMGCGEEHPLQAFEFGLIAQNLHGGNNSAQNSFLRPEAYLGLVFLSDEDDCSAATNDGMFGDKPELRGESASLRCATRGHACRGANLSDDGPGYPTNQMFQTDLASCSARTDSCQNTTDGFNQGTDTSGPTSCSPLKSLKNLANELKGLKGDQAAEKMLVAGIFGWPLAGSDGRIDFSKAEPYKIDAVPNPNSADTAHPKVYDLWPGCYDPDHRPKTAGQFDSEAWAFGAQPGLRMSAFIDEFGDNGLKFSACERDYTMAMSMIGNALARKLQYPCIDAKLMDAEPATETLEPDCRVVVRVPVVDSTTHKITYIEQAPSLPLCPTGATPDTVTSDCWQLGRDLERCPTSGQLVTLVRTRAEIANGPLPEGTKLGLQCRTCPEGISVSGCSH